MFVLHTSNKTANLLEHLQTVLKTPLSEVFAQEIFIIQNQGMARWLSQQLASEYEVWANFEFSFPGKYFGEIIDNLSEADNRKVYTQDKLVWHFDALLRSLEGDEFTAVQQYIQGEGVGLKRFQLSQSLAFLFDQYQFMRPDWLQAWEQGQTVTDNQAEQWQRSLWLKLQGKSKGSVWLDALAILDEMTTEQAREVLPERLSVFGINTMSPIYLQFLQVIGKHIDVHFYLLNPSHYYWADLPSKRALAKKQYEMGADIDSIEFYKINNPMLAMLGQQGRDFQQLLLQNMEFDHEYNSFEAFSPNTLLGQIQNDIEGNTTTSQQLQADASLSIHSCHSRMRETEVIKDALLKCLDENEDLSLRDVVVMAPDIQEYAAYIPAVFADIPHAVADRSMLSSNTVLDLLLRFMKLSQGRWGWESILDVLEQEVVYLKFGLNASDLEVLRHWINSTEIRWGESKEHRHDLGLPAFSENSWKAGLDRLLMGYIVADDQQFCDDVLPYIDLEGSQAQALGGLYDFFSLLSQARVELGKEASLKQWSQRLIDYVGELFSDDEAFRYQCTAVSELVNTLQDYAKDHHDDIDLSVILHYLNQTASSISSASGFMRGQLTFCSMLPMRSIPFKVIALMGMNEGEYPKADINPAFDLMDNDFRKGDRSRRVDDRYQFLEIMLSTQEQLIISYLGQSINSNEPIPPSVVLSELMETISAHYKVSESQLVVKHPLQAHNQAYFAQESHLPPSYSTRAHDIACCFSTVSNAQVESWWQGELELPKEEISRAASTIELSDLLAFYRNPQRYFVEKQLRIIIPVMDSVGEESEPFEVGGLDAYLINQEWVSRQFNDESDDDTFYQQLMAQGRWPNGQVGVLEFAERKADIQSFCEEIKSVTLGEALEDVSIDIQIGDYRLLGKLGNLYENGSLFYRYADMKGPDLMTAWISHLIKLYIPSMPQTPTWLFTRDQQRTFEQVKDAEALLQQMIEHYLAGCKRPSPFLLQPGIDRQVHKSNPRARKPLMTVATESFNRSLEYDPYWQLLYRGKEMDDIINDDFESSCDSLLEPIWLVDN